MPAAMRYWGDNPNDNNDKALMQEAEQERRDRAAWYHSVCAQYDGKHKRFLKVREGIVDPNVIINRDGQAIDARLNFFFPDMFSMQLDEDEPTTEEPSEDTADAPKENPTEVEIFDIIEDNGGASLLQDCGLFGELMGHIYVRIYATIKPVGKNEDGQDTYAVDDTMPYRIVALNPSTIITYWSAEDKDTVLWYEHQYTSDRKYKVDYVNLNAQGGYGWLIKKYRMNNNAWQFMSEEAWPLLNGPIVDWQHLREPRSYYGRSSLGASRLNDALNKVASDVKQILRYHAAPRIIGKGVNPADIQSTSIDGFMTIPASTSEAQTDVKSLEMQSDLTSSMNFLNYLDGAHAADMKIARISSTEALKNITNLGLKVAFADLLAETTRVHRNHSAGWRKIVLTIMELQNKPIEGVKPKITWPMALPMSELEATQTVQMQIDMGVLSKESAAGVLNIDWQQEQERLDSEGADAQAMADAVGQLVGQAAARQQQPPNGNGMPVNGKDMR